MYSINDIKKACFYAGTNPNELSKILHALQANGGTPGVGVKTITGTIDASNKLTLTFTLTDSTTQTVEGTITPPTPPAV